MPRTFPIDASFTGLASSLALLLGVLMMGSKAGLWNDNPPAGLSGVRNTLFSGLPQPTPASGPPLLPCGPSFSVFLTEVDASGCCYTLAYDYTPSGGAATALEVEILPASASFSALEYNLASGWSYQALAPDRLRWQHSGGILPAGSQEFFRFCVDNGPYGIPAQLAVSWRAGVEEICKDTLGLPCWQCLAPQNESLTCRDGGGYSYTLEWTNRTNYTIHRLRLEEPPGQNLIAEEEISLATPLLPGATTTPLNITIAPEADGLGELCFNLTASRLLGNSSALDCCTFTQCLELPECDQCCTPLDDYIDDVNAGFTITIDCDAGALTAVYDQWWMCDRTFWTLANLNTGQGIGGMVMGNSIEFTVQNQTSYSLCMRVERLDEALMNCYGDTSITVCENFYVNCPQINSPELQAPVFGGPENEKSTIPSTPEQARLCPNPALISSDPCPAVWDPVCGCDSLTYSNLCYALNNGVTLWSPGECGGTDSLTQNLLLTAAPDPDGGAQLNWLLNADPSNYDFFVLLGRWPGEAEFKAFATVPVLPGQQAYDFLHVNPMPGNNEYQVAAVNVSGQPLYSNRASVFIINGQERPVIYTFPNPATEMLNIVSSQDGPAEIELISPEGRSLLRQDAVFEGAPVQVDISRLSGGLFIARLRFKNGTTGHRRFVKVR